MCLNLVKQIVFLCYEILEQILEIHDRLNNPFKICALLKNFS